MAARIASSASTEQWIFTGGSASSFTISVFLISSASETVLPFTHSVASEDEAIADPQPNVLNLASSITCVSGLTLICKRITSPHSGAPTSPVPTSWLDLSIDKSSQDVGTGLVGAPECGDVMRLQIKVNPETQVIEEAKFKTFGCGSAIASSSLATEWVKGKTVSEALEIKNTDIVTELALPPVKIHCSVLAEDAIRAAISDWKKKNGVAEAEKQAVAQ